MPRFTVLVTEMIYKTFDGVEADSASDIDDDLVAELLNNCEADVTGGDFHIDEIVEEVDERW